MKKVSTLEISRVLAVVAVRKGGNSQWGGFEGDNDINQTNR